MKKYIFFSILTIIFGIVNYSYANPIFLRSIVKSNTSKNLVKILKEKRGADLIKKGKKILIKSRIDKNLNFFWNKFLKKHPEALSEKNKQRIKNGKSPIVDKQWIKTFPEHRWNIGEKIEHHHINHGSKTIPLPKTLHRGSGNYQILHKSKTKK